MAEEAVRFATEMISTAGPVQPSQRRKKDPIVPYFRI